MVSFEASEVCERIFDRSMLMQFFLLTMPNPNVNSLEKENESLKSEIAALKKNLKTFRIRSNLASTMLMSPTMAAK